MRHKKAGRKLGRDPSHRKALYANLTAALVEHGRIRTTEAKAKEVRPIAEQMITLGKRGDVAAHRQAVAFLRSKSVAHVLFAEVAPRFADRPAFTGHRASLGGRLRGPEMDRRAGQPEDAAALLHAVGPAGDGEVERLGCSCSRRRDGRSPSAASAGQAARYPRPSTTAKAETWCREGGRQAGGRLGVAEAFRYRRPSQASRTGGVRRWARQSAMFITAEPPGRGSVDR